MATLRETFKDIADAIREKGVVGTMTPSQMPSKIDSIEGGDGVVTQIIERTLSGEYYNDRITKIMETALGGFTGLTKVGVPNVTAIGEYVFSGDTHLQLIDFRQRTLDTVPTLTNINAFGSLPSTYKIVVPDSLYDQWITKTNWSSSSIKSHIVKASEYVEE